MEEIEVPTEHLHEEIQEKAAEAREEGKSPMYIAISTAFMAVIAAIAGMMAGHHSNEAVIEQIKASDQWAFYQAKSIKAEIRALQPAGANTKSPEQVKKEEEEIQKEAKEDEASSQNHLEHHILLARSVTLFQIAIAISAIAILTRKRLLWVVGMVIASVGVVFFVLGLLF
jgi:hypothetical protein